MEQRTENRRLRRLELSTRYAESRKAKKCECGCHVFVSFHPSDCTLRNTQRWGGMSKVTKPQYRQKIRGTVTSVHHCHHCCHGSMGYRFTTSAVVTVVTVVAVVAVVTVVTVIGDSDW
jgi:hypothetical protein